MGQDELGEKMEMKAESMSISSWENSARQRVYHISLESLWVAEECGSQGVGFCFVHRFENRDVFGRVGDEADKDVQMLLWNRDRSKARLERLQDVSDAGDPSRNINRRGSEEDI